MAKKSDSAAAVLPEEPATELAMVMDYDFGFTGLEGLDAGDIRTPSILFNLKGKDEETGRLRQLDEFLVTDTGTYHKQLRVALVAMAKSRSFRVFNEDTNRNELICSSYDRKTGTMRRDHPTLAVNEGAVRRCEDCPDAEWFKDKKGKNRKNCNEVFNVFGALLSADLQVESEFLVRFAKTSAPPFTEYLGKHHVKKHPKLRGRDLPLFVYEVLLTLDVDKGGNFARPVLTKGRPLPEETVKRLAELCQTFLEIREEYVKKGEADDARHSTTDVMDTTGESSGGGGGFRQDDFADS
ncbi:MAG TPA: hypothetical protein VED01_03350 [Burkholderiales bacterium]|nr:hypothetical protein [Burkholderiales bacterium]